MKKIGFILGTRPEIIKMYSLIVDAKDREMDFFIIHTNQHYDEKMDKIFFEELEIPQPKYNLNIGSGKQGEQVAKMIVGIENILIVEKPDIIFVQGDTNTVLAGALTASKLSIKLGHIEAGLRSYDRTMPEEINRIVTDHVSDYLFAPTEKQKNILLSEGIDNSKIIITGNTIVDAVYRASALSNQKSTILSDLSLEPNKYCLLTCHRPSNTDNDENFTVIINAVSKICHENDIKCVFPFHPRLKNKIDSIKKDKNFILIEPVGYLDMLQLQKESNIIFTDSGGIQEESCILEKKCVVLRTNTERPETIEVGGAILLDSISTEDIYKKYDIIKNKVVKWTNPFGDGKAADYILRSI